MIQVEIRLAPFFIAAAILLALTACVKINVGYASLLPPPAVEPKEVPYGAKQVQAQGQAKGKGQTTQTLTVQTSQKDRQTGPFTLYIR